MKILADESVDYPVVASLRKLNYDVYYIAEIKSGIKDEEVLEIAQKENRILLTSDKDFGELAYRQKLANNGVVLYRLSGLSNERKSLIITDSFKSHSSEMANKFTVITSNHIRIRKIL